MHADTIEATTSPNVVERLRLKTEYAWRQGFTVRFELLDGRDAAWCEIGKQKMIFVDLALTAGEQLEQIERTLNEFEQSRLNARLRQVA